MRHKLICDLTAYAASHKWKRIAMENGWMTLRFFVMQPIFYIPRTVECVYEWAWGETRILIIKSCIKVGISLFIWNLINLIKRFILYILIDRDVNAVLANRCSHLFRLYAMNSWRNPNRVAQSISVGWSLDSRKWRNNQLCCWKLGLLIQWNVKKTHRIKVGIFSLNSEASKLPQIHNAIVLNSQTV